MRTAHDIGERYRSAVESSDLPALEALYHPDVLLDAHVPNWRFQLQGRAAVARYTGGGLPGPGRFTAFHLEPTAAGGALAQLEWRQRAVGGEPVVRQLHLWQLEDGRIVEQTLFCAGIWSPRRQAQMAEEAPLLRP